MEFSTPILHDMIYGIFCLRLLSFIWCYGELNDEMNKYYCARREILQQTAPHLVDSICAYRAGYIAQVSELFALHLFLSFEMQSLWKRTLEWLLLFG